MIFLLLSIIASTCVLITFRMLGKFGANSKHTITFSYLVSALTAVLLFPDILINTSLAWFWPAAALGAAFYLVFLLIAKTTQTNGIATAGVATKMSVVIPVCTGIFLLGESIDAFKFIGIFTGIVAVFLSSGAIAISDLKWSLLTFLGSGLIDASLKLFQVWWVSVDQFPSLLTTIFLFAFTAGCTHHIILKDRLPSRSSILGGLFLGLFNFGTVYFLLLALAQPEWESSLIYPINNLGIVIFSAITATLLFGEVINRRGLLGLFLALLSISFLFYSSTSK